MVDVLEAIAQYELVSDGKVIVRDRDDGVCISSPDLCSLPAGGKSPKGVKKKQKQKQSKNKTKQNKTKRNETKRSETKRNETKRNKTKQKKQNKAKQNKTKTKQKQKRVKGLKKNFCTHKSSYIFKHFESLPSIPLNGLYRNNRSCPLKNSRPNSRKRFPSTVKNPIINSIKKSIIPISHFRVNNCLYYIGSFSPISL